jgi:carboxyl-terminal processing protease
MLPASNRGVGMNIGFPDVCLTPAGPAVVPIPYPNFALNVQAVPFSPIVKVSMMNALNQMSKIPMTFGDDAGVAHPVFKQMGQYTMGNPIVFVDLMPAINLLCPTTGNMMNNPIGAVLVPSAVNVMYTLLPSSDPAPHEDAGAEAQDGGAYDRAVSLAELSALGDALAGPVVDADLLPEGVGYLALDRVASDADRQVYNAVNALEAKGMRALLLDLRDNPGGDLGAAARLCGDFLSPGTVVVRLDDGEGGVTVVRAPEGEPYRVPLVILVNEGTASAAEVVAACLKSEGRAVIVGAPTFGKGLVQALGAAEGRGVRAGSVGRALTGAGGEIEGVGVEPDLGVRGPRRVRPPAGEAVDRLGDVAILVAWVAAAELGRSR